MTVTRASSSDVLAVRPPWWPALGARGVELVELMDEQDCDRDLLRRTYRAFPVVNALVSGWHRLYRTRLRPLLAVDRPTRLLDIGSGGGDVARALHAWARRDGLMLEVVAIDPDHRAHEFATSRPVPEGLEFRRASSGDLVRAGETFDLVVSNHVLHHLDERSRTALLTDSEQLGTRLVLHADIERARVAYLAYRATTWPWRRRSFVHVDGLLSIRRSYRADELAAVAPAGWTVERHRPYRLVLRRGRPGRGTNDGGTGGDRADA